MSLDRESRCEGRGCLRARRRRSTTTHGETEEGFGLGRRSGKGHGGMLGLPWLLLGCCHGWLTARGMGMAWNCRDQGDWCWRDGGTVVGLLVAAMGVRGLPEVAAAPAEKAEHPRRSLDWGCCRVREGGGLNESGCVAACRRRGDPVGGCTRPRGGGARLWREVESPAMGVPTAAWGRCQRWLGQEEDVLGFAAHGSWRL